jgi:hypothetical protein
MESGIARNRSSETCRVKSNYIERGRGLSIDYDRLRAVLEPSSVRGQRFIFASKRPISGQKGVNSDQKQGKIGTFLSLRVNTDFL